MAEQLTQPNTSSKKQKERVVRRVENVNCKDGQEVSQNDNIANNAFLLKICIMEGKRIRFLEYFSLF